MKGVVDRLLGTLVLIFVGPTLLLLALGVRAAPGNSIFEEQCRLHRGRMFRTRRFRGNETAFGRVMRQYRFDEMPVALDLAAGRARLIVETRRAFDGRLQRALAIAAPRPMTSAHPTRHNAPQISMIARGE